MRKFSALFFAAILSVYLFVPAFAATSDSEPKNVEVYIVGPGTAIQDVQPGSWHYEYSRWALSLGLLDVGTNIKLPGRWFNPYEVADRTDLINALYKYAQFLGVDVSAGKDTNILSYTDAAEIREGKYDAWQWACGTGLCGGNGETKLYPNDVITREYMIRMLYCLGKLIGADVTAFDKNAIEQFTDKTTVSKDSYTPFSWAVGNGIINGTSNDKLSPLINAERAQLAAVLYRFNEKYGKEAYSDSVVIELAGNASTGYGWYPDVYDKNIINVDPLMYIQDNPGFVGSGGTFGFSIKGVSEGETTLTFLYMRPWEGKTGAVKSVTYKIKVKPDLSLSLKAIG